MVVGDQTIKGATQWQNLALQSCQSVAKADGVTFMAKADGVNF